MSASSCFDADGKLAGEFVIIGLFTSTTYTKSTATIPYLRRKVIAVVRRAGFDPDGHSGKALVNVLETYPRDELFQIDAERALPLRARDPQARRASARARPAAARPLRPFRLDRSFTSRATGTTATPARRSATIWRASTTAVSARSFRSFRKGRWCACISSSGGIDRERAEPDRAALESAVAGLVRSWADGLMDALSVAHEPDRGRASARALRRRVLAGLSGGLSADRGGQ